MRIDPLAIELDENGYGVVMPEGATGQRLPKLIANRPEPGRFTRLARIIDEAKAIAGRELGQKSAHALVDAMSSILDSKGDFNVVWRGSVHAKAFEDILDRALATEGESEIIHDIDPGQ